MFRTFFFTLSPSDKSIFFYTCSKQQSFAFIKHTCCIKYAYNYHKNVTAAVTEFPMEQENKQHHVVRVIQIWIRLQASDLPYLKVLFMSTLSAHRYDHNSLKDVQNDRQCQYGVWWYGGKMSNAEIRIYRSISSYCLLLLPFA